MGASGPVPAHCGAGGGTAAACCTANPAAAEAVQVNRCSQSAAHEPVFAAPPAMLPAPVGDRLLLRGLGVSGGPTSTDRPPIVRARGPRWAGGTESAAMLAVSATEGAAGQYHSLFLFRCRPCASDCRAVPATASPATMDVLGFQKGALLTPSAGLRLDW